MRGKVFFHHTAQLGGRITPAYAGKSFTQSCKLSRQLDHPRLCGEKSSYIPVLYARRGSPPPMRGKVKATPPHTHEPRITPAYAGKRLMQIPCVIAEEDHPRLCGEKHKSRRANLSMIGSPPPMRGKVPIATSVQSTSGITPAYAGKSGLNPACMPAKKDHPRLCGEKFCVKLFNKFYQGSPPPMRGKGRCFGVIEYACRITPAYAGKSFSHKNYLQNSWDHPRLCGEKTKYEHAKKCSGGSPPPMRGKVFGTS